VGGLPKECEGVTYGAIECGGGKSSITFREFSGCSDGLRRGREPGGKRWSGHAANEREGMKRGDRAGRTTQVDDRRQTGTECRGRKKIQAGASAVGRNRSPYCLLRAWDREELEGVVRGVVPTNDGRNELGGASRTKGTSLQT